MISLETKERSVKLKCNILAIYMAVDDGQILTGEKESRSDLDMH